MENLECYAFSLNQYRAERLSKCPICQRPTHVRKFALFIHIDRWGPMVLGKSCKYCAGCELIIAHQHELEFEVAQSFSRLAPEIIENDYLVLGTMEKKVWLQGVKGDSLRFEEILEHIADFKKIYDLTVDPGRLVSSGCVKPNTITPLNIHKIFHRNQKYGFNFSLLTNPSTIPIISTLAR